MDGNRRWGTGEENADINAMLRATTRIKNHGALGGRVSLTMTADMRGAHDPANLLPDWMLLTRPMAVAGS